MNHFNAKHIWISETLDLRNMANDGDQPFFLAWNSFKSATSSAFAQLWSDGHFSDVTLVAEDEQLFTAHKYVLSANSPFFKSILIANQDVRSQEVYS